MFNLLRNRALAEGLPQSHCCAACQLIQPEKLSHSHSGGDSVSNNYETLNLDEDMQSMYVRSLKSVPPGAAVLFQNTARLNKITFCFIPVHRWLMESHC